jgi:hypothetical protein
LSDVDELVWEETADRMTAAQFAATHPYWFVSYDEPDEEGELGFRTELAGRPPDTKRLIFAPLTKSQRNPYLDRISVGRARNSDVVVRHASVSKLHAHFREADGALTLTDVGSHNGTRVDGRLLVAHRPQAVAAGSLVLFGRVEARILTATGAHELLRRR